jgi:LysM repeat protein
MEGKDSPQNVIDNYQRKQQLQPFIIGGLAILLIMIGVIVFIVWLASPSRPALPFLSTATPTPTSTFTPSPTVPTATPTNTATETPTPLPPTTTPTASGPFTYVVLSNDSCWDIAAKFNVGLDVLLAINNFGSTCPIQPGQKILIPGPDTKLPTATPFPSGVARGTKVEYIIQLGDTVASIASKFNADVETLKKDNHITDPNSIKAGDKLIIRVNEVTPTKTLAPTSTPVPGTAQAEASTQAPTASTNNAAATATPIILGTVAPTAAAQ